MPFSCSPKAEDKAQVALGNPALVGVRYDGGIEQGGRFQRIFPGEERPDIQAAGLGNWNVELQVKLNHFEMAQPALVQVNMPFTEVGADACQFGFNLRFAQREGAANNVPD